MSGVDVTQRVNIVSRILLWVENIQWFLLLIVSTLNPTMDVYCLRSHGGHKVSPLPQNLKNQKWFINETFLTEALFVFFASVVCLFSCLVCVVWCDYEVISITKPWKWWKLDIFGIAYNGAINVYLVSHC